MIETSSWDTTVTDIVPYTWKTAALPTPYIAKLYDTIDSISGSVNPTIVNIVQKVGTPSDLLKVSGIHGVYAEIQLNNAYDVALLDTIYNMPTTTTTTIAP